MADDEVGTFDGVAVSEEAVIGHVCDNGVFDDEAAVMHCGGGGRVEPNAVRTVLDDGVLNAVGSALGIQPDMPPLTGFVAVGRVQAESAEAYGAVERALDKQAAALLYPNAGVGAEMQARAFRNLQRNAFRNRQIAEDGIGLFVGYVGIGPAAPA